MVTSLMKGEFDLNGITKEAMNLINLRYSWQRIAEKYDRIYQTIAGREKLR